MTEKGRPVPLSLLPLNFAYFIVFSCAKNMLEYIGGNLPARNFPGRLPVGNSPGRNLPGGNCPVGIHQGEFTKGEFSGN